MVRDVEAIDWPFKGYLFFVETVQDIDPRGSRKVYTVGSCGWHGGGNRLRPGYLAS